MCAIFLSSCSTQYQDGSNPFHLTGGYESKKGIGNLEKILFHGNGFTSVEQANQFAMRRAAEIGKQRNKPYFALYQTLTRAAVDVKSNEPLTELIFSKPTSYFFVMYHSYKEDGDLNVEKILEKYNHKRKIS